MVHEILAVGSLECNCSIFGDEATREALAWISTDNHSPKIGEGGSCGNGRPQAAKRIGSPGIRLSNPEIGV
jgi:hypothetical protein